MRAMTIGRPTLTTRVESWECDFNDHWNARFYARSFQQAAERVATLDGRDNPGLGLLGARTIRFHRELLAGTGVEVRSARVSGGEYGGAVLHLLGDARGLAATALDLPGTGGAALPRASAREARLAFPRAGAPADAEENWAGARIAETGPVRPAELDHTGAPLLEEILRRVALGLHALLDGLGFTRDFTAEHGIGRMAVETRIRPLAAGPLRPGALLRVRSRLARTGPRSFATRHRLETDTGAALARVGHTLVAVDLATRRAVAPPGFLPRPEAGEAALR
ncbi:hypothetical protein [Amaricoccus solimangrovi]|uniref:Thioesterase n=1 Tax=Amaricoccus solimangrovi TaxID=2589815 RepID=A0A501WSL6_9RHOB|nr:hypothetical protein [Amaricoccus solimangrovi]TPE51345.1 hypothetical protein FJM51_08875 [Amaricoccus solimangrovi]